MPKVESMTGAKS